MEGTEKVHISYEHVSVKYDRELLALSDISLSINHGEFVIFIGQTGAGKSTFLKLLNRLARPSEGKVSIDGKNIADFKPRSFHKLRRAIGFVPQDYALLPKKTVWENVAYAMRAVGATRKEIRARVPEILEQVNIGHRANSFPNQLSGGEQQRVAIGRALITRPPLLLADEPTGNLDPQHSLEIMALLQELNKQGTTVLVASHDMMVISTLNARLISLEGGKIKSDEVITPNA